MAMNKSWLAIFFLGMSNQAMTQTSHLVLPQDPPVSGAINIVVSNLDENEGNTYFAEAEKNERQGDFDEAITLFGKAAFEYNSARQFSRYGTALLRLSNVHYLQSHYTEAEQVVLNVALKNYSKIGSKSGQMESYNQLGRIYLAANKLTQSMWFYTQQGILAKQIGNDNAYIGSVLGLASVKIRKKEYTMASRDLNRAELLAKSANISQFRTQIREARALIPSVGSVKKKS
jgi:tetratricopeptide (TPR) repeat protein